MKCNGFGQKLKVLLLITNSFSQLVTVRFKYLPILDRDTMMTAPALSLRLLAPLLSGLATR